MIPVALCLNDRVRKLVGAKNLFVWLCSFRKERLLDASSQHDLLETRLAETKSLTNDCENSVNRKVLLHGTRAGIIYLEYGVMFLMETNDSRLSDLLQ